MEVKKTVHLLMKAVNTLWPCLIILLRNRPALIISQLSDSSQLFEICPFHFRQAGGFSFPPLSLFFSWNKLTMWARKSCSVESLMVEEAIFCHVVHISAMLVEGRDTCWRRGGGILHADGRIVARCMHETHSGQKKCSQEAAWNTQM